MPTSPEIDPSDWKEKAQKLLKGNLTNLGRKVLAGETLSVAEVKLLKEEASGNGIGDSANEPRFAKNQTQLARILGISRKTIQRYAKKPGAPVAAPNGSLDVSKWRTFLAANEVIEDETTDHAALKARQILLQNELLEQKVKTARGLLVPIEDVDRDTVKMIDTAKRVLLRGPSALAPQVVGVSIPEAEKLLRDWLHDALAALHTNPLGKKGKEDSDVKPG